MNYQTTCIHQDDIYSWILDYIITYLIVTYDIIVIMEPKVLAYILLNAL